MIYRASRDGDSAKVFHDICDNISPTLIVVNTREGWKFGGYSEVSWHVDSFFFNYEQSYKECNNSFIFSLNLKKKYLNKHTGAEIFCSKRKGPSFGFELDFSIADNCLQRNSSCNFPGSYGDKEERNEFNGNKTLFLVKELEVYSVQLKDK